MSKRTAMALAAFFAVSSVMSAGCMRQSDAPPANVDTQGKESAHYLTDEDGNKYALRTNADGTETATYADGKSVTFRRDDNGNVQSTSGDASILPMLMTSWLLYHGFSHSGGSYDASRRQYVFSSPPAAISGQERADAFSRYNASHNGAKAASTDRPSTGNSVGRSSAASTNGGSRSSSTYNSAKGGFGSAGARGGAS